MVRKVFQAHSRKKDHCVPTCNHAWHQARVDDGTPTPASMQQVSPVGGAAATGRPPRRGHLPPAGDVHGHRRRRLLLSPIRGFCFWGPHLTLVSSGVGMDWGPRDRARHPCGAIAENLLLDKIKIVSVINIDYDI